MPYPVDPSSLEGDELDRWYRRSPQDIEQERQAAADRRYATFFDRAQIPAEPSVQPPTRRPNEMGGGPDDVLWIANGAGGYRAVRSGAPDYEIALGSAPSPPDNLPADPADPEAADLVDIGNPHNPRLRREWVRANGQAWPRTDDGRNFHVAHQRAISDGGTNTLDNIEPMHPDDHIAQHINNGDAARWARRQWIARAFGGRVQPATPARRVNGFGMLGMLPNILGVLNGRIRRDTPLHTLYDLTGYAAPDDEKRMTQAVCRSMGTNDPNANCV